MEVIETQLVQRAYDGHWERIVKIMDHENAYEYQDEAGVRVKLIPEKWLTVAVYPFLIDFFGE